MSCIIADKICLSGLSISDDKIKDVDGLTLEVPQLTIGDTDGNMVTVNNVSVTINTGLRNTQTLVYSADADYQILGSDYRIILNTEGSRNLYLTLPPIATSNGMILYIKRTYAAGNYNHIVKPTDGDSLEFMPTGVYTLDIHHEVVELHCIENSWIIMSSYAS